MYKKISRREWTLLCIGSLLFSGISSSVFLIYFSLFCFIKTWLNRELKSGELWTWLTSSLFLFVTTKSYALLILSIAFLVQIINVSGKKKAKIKNVKKIHTNCSECNSIIASKENYCGNCGSKNFQESKKDTTSKVTNKPLPWLET